MIMETYEKKYKEALERARQFSEKPYLEDSKGIVDYIFPELKESEDERIRIWIRKELESKYVVDNIVNNVMADKALAWLEKKGEQKPANKVEPKFKVGDWIVFNGLTLYIKEVVKGYYRTISKGGITNSYDWDIDNVARLWTIQDAKVGDILVDGNLPFIFKKIDTNKYSYAFCGISVDDGFKIKSEGKLGEWTWMQDIKPATKEQRDLLFQKMHEAGYEWDAEKKELMKIEQKPAYTKEYDFHGIKFIPKFAKGDIIKDKKCGEVSTIEDFSYDTGLYTHTYGQFPITIQDNYEIIAQKPAWSKEDEKIIRRIDSLLYSQCKIHGSEYEEIHNWLKSLRPQKQWKPSDNELEVLRLAAEKDGTCLMGLYEQLKKLKG